MRPARVRAAFRLEAAALSRSVADLSEHDWDRPSRCVPWRVRDLVAHVLVAVGRVPDMLTAPPPLTATVVAAGYYRSDGRFAEQANAARVAVARDEAAGRRDGAALARAFAATWQAVDRLCDAEPDGRVVRTRHGDCMLLSEFLVTRVVELAVHGLDLAEALAVEPWLTPQAGDLVQQLLLGPDSTAGQQLNGDQLSLLRKATGREPLDATEAAHIDRLGIRWLTFG